MNIEKKKLLPFILTFAIILADQITKFLVEFYIPLDYANGRLGIGPAFLGDFIRIIRVYNTGVAFSLGDSWPLAVRRLSFGLVPLAVMVLVVVVYFRNKDFSMLQRWAICGILGGGFGNLIDRFFRARGVVDFIDVKFYGLFGMERWPTFNVADSAVVVCGILLVVSFLIQIAKESSQSKRTK
ncbi:MAG: signal peptidase II [Treponema sp.]|nr:MAG: signal peptidase II [Treponema sp.]